MQRVRLTLDPGDRSVDPVYDLLAGGAAYLRTAELVQWNVATDPIGTLLWIRGDLDAFDAALDGIGTVHEHEVLPVSERGAYVYVHADPAPLARALFDAFRGGAVVAGLPAVEYNRDGTATMTLLGPAAQVDDVLDAVPESVTVEIDAVGGPALAREPALSGLSPRQREAIETALELGYYDRPRRATDADVGDAMGCSPSTASEHRAKAEARLVRALLGDEE